MNQYTEAGDYSLNYDKDGNLVEKTMGPAKWSFVYDDNNRLISSTDPGMEKSYIYNSLGQLVSVIENGVERQFVYDPAGIGNLVGEYNADGSLINLYGYGIGLVSRNNCFYTFDGNGNTSEITFSAGEVANSYMYAPFGAPLAS